MKNPPWRGFDQHERAQARLVVVLTASAVALLAALMLLSVNSATCWAALLKLLTAAAAASEVLTAFRALSNLRVHFWQHLPER
jgi:hypothetical protein